MKEELGPIKRKREGSIPLRELDQKIKGTNCRKCEVLGKDNIGEETTRQHHQAK